MTFSGEHKGYAIQVIWWNDRLTFRCDALQVGKDYDSVDKIEKAIDAYDLKLRKQFSNPVAWLKSYRSELTQVEVTAIDSDEYVWIKKGTRREKARRSELFVDAEAVKVAIAYEKQLGEDIADIWKSIKRWEPQP